MDQTAYSTGYAIWIILTASVFVLIYLLPFWLALLRKVDSLLVIFILNLFLGWTIVGWIITLVLACIFETKTAVHLREMQIAELARRAGGRGNA